jgi:hypothetical protein
LNQSELKNLLKEFPGATRKILMTLGYERGIGENVDPALIGLLVKKEITYVTEKKKPGSGHVGNYPRQYYLVET